MKKVVLLCILLAVAMIGFVAADTGVPETIETQGFLTPLR
jgi:outer membrane lipoprotein-sorting protein